MSKKTYTYHITIDNWQTVNVQKSDTNRQQAGNPSGEFGFKGERKSRIEELSQQIFQSQQDEESITEDEIFELGTELFEALFDNGLRTDFLTLLNTLPKDTQLRIELGIDEANLPEVAVLPWEFLCVPDNLITGELWLGTNINLSLSRRRRRWNAPPPIKLKPNERLRIAVAVSAPKDKDLGPVQYEKLWSELQELAKENQQIELLDLVDSATRDKIDACLEKEPHIFHFIGHGRLHNQRNKKVGQLAITRETGYARWVDARRFSGLFTRHRPAVVFLQACEGGALSASQAFAGVASQIVQQNIPVVVAMQYEISNANARQFAREFYSRLANFEPVDKCVQEGRYKISDWHETPHFATPVLFMRVEDGHLFEAPSSQEKPDSPTSAHTRKVTPENSKPKRPSVPTSQLRNKLRMAFDDTGFSSFCLDYFPQVYDSFSNGMPRDQKIDLLLTHCRRQPTGYQALFDALRQEYNNSYYPREELVPVIQLLETSL